MVRGIGQVDKEAGKIHFAHQRPKGRHEDVADERRDDLAEGAADDHADRHVEDIAAHGTPPLNSFSILPPLAGCETIGFHASASSARTDNASIFNERTVRPEALEG